MLTKDEVWNEVEKLIEGEGLSVFDLDCPTGTRGVLRVYLCNPDGSAKNVGLQECTRVARKINDASNVENLIPGECTLEVSSPGVNRKLSRVRHFAGACGERVKLSVTRKAEDGAEKKEVIHGRIISANESLETVMLEREDTKISEEVPLSAIREARVDFIFE